MSVPTVWPFALLALAAYRTWRLLAVDEILDPPRNKLFRSPTGRHLKFVTCPWCFGAWCSIAWWVAWQIYPHATLVVAVPFAISLVVGLIARNLDP